MITFPQYKGFLVKEYGPDVHKDGAPTFLVLVAPPAYRTALIRISSPAAIKAKPIIIYGCDGSE
tara:strand:- start:1850 stop:2041 length:192 start_codon:yes stop_codon:yes gene_type:complete